MSPGQQAMRRQYPQRLFLGNSLKYFLVEIRVNSRRRKLIQRLPQATLRQNLSTALRAMLQVPLKSDQGRRVQAARTEADNQVGGGIFAAFDWAIHRSSPFMPYAPGAPGATHKPETAAISLPIPNNLAHLRSLCIPTLHTYASSPRPAVLPADSQSPAEPPPAWPRRATVVPRFSFDPAPAWRYPPWCPRPGWNATARSCRPGSNSIPSGSRSGKATS